jgi:hypothetical protein
MLKAFNYVPLSVMVLILIESEIFSNIEIDCHLRFLPLIRTGFDSAPLDLFKNDTIAYCPHLEGITGFEPDFLKYLFVEYDSFFPEFMRFLFRTIEESSDNVYLLVDLLQHDQLFQEPIGRDMKFSRDFPGRPSFPNHLS